MRQRDQACNPLVAAVELVTGPFQVFCASIPYSALSRDWAPK